MKPEDFLSILHTPSKSKTPTFRMGTIPSDYVSGRPTIKFDGETSASTRTYPYLSSYSPSANDRVLIALVGHGGVILGKIL